MNKVMLFGSFTRPKGGENEKFMTALKRGFTLIELLIVIAILGVLAVVVLVAINPVQQLARTRDAGRISSISQVGHAVEAYYTSHNGTYPVDLTALVTSGEINQIPDEVVNSTGTAVCSGAPNNGWCYATSGTGAVVNTKLEADTNEEAATCADDTAYINYVTGSGRTCVTCGGLGPDDVCP